jgi:hypothetical protein
MRLSVLFLPGQRMYGDSVWFDIGLILLFALHFSLFQLNLHAAHEKNIATL